MGQLRRHMEAEKASFDGQVQYSFNQTDWYYNKLSITKDGQLYNTDDDTVYSRQLHGCEVQIVTEESATVYVKTLEGHGMWFRPHNSELFDKLVACLMLWQNLKPSSLAKKWYSEPRAVLHGSVHELLVCRFKVYGPLPRNKNVNHTRGAAVVAHGSQTVQEGWFSAMGVLKSNGSFNLLNELDGSLYYAIDITKLLGSEIRQVHVSMYNNANMLFVGIINEMRALNTMKNLQPPRMARNLIHLNNKPVASCNRILLEFPLHIDLEDWFVGLNYFAQREYVGYRHISEPSESLRVSKKVFIDIIEANFNESLATGARVYGEVSLWNSVWARTAPVQSEKNPFWKEEFILDLPICTEYFHILIKRCGSKEYGPDDEVLGTVFVTPDLFATTHQEERLPIFDDNSVQVGKLLLKITLNEYHILSSRNFKILENVLVNGPLDQLIAHIKANTATAKLEDTSLMLLDIFQALGAEDSWFKALMEDELVVVDELTRKLRTSQSKTGANNVFNTLFRGNSILTKSLEKYNLRIGQEYLEKVMGEFIGKISVEKKDCELDERAIRSERSDKSSEEISKIAAANFNTLYGYAEHLWKSIYTTSNDLPEQIKHQLKSFRNKVELACDPEDKTTALNCLSAFVFLRFFCPAILNPKLFYLTKDHQTGRVQRTLTLLAKILLTLGNRSHFVAHKEPYLMAMNQFIDGHSDEVTEYFDRITGRRNDFTEKVLDMSQEVKRFDLGLIEEESTELPTNPYLIDKYLRLVELAHVLSNYKDQQQQDVNDRDEKYQIGSLEFEKSEFLDLAGDNETQGFLKSLLKSDDNIFSFINSNITLKDLQIQAGLLMKKTRDLEEYLEEDQSAAVLSTEQWKPFIDGVLKRAMLNQKKQIVYSDEAVSGHKMFSEGALSGLKLRFVEKGVEPKMVKSSSSGSVGTMKARGMFRWMKKK